jgi:hypothetical protein
MSLFLGVGRIMLDPITTVETPMRLMCFASWMISDAVCDAEIFLADVIETVCTLMMMDISNLSALFVCVLNCICKICMFLNSIKVPKGVLIDIWG